MEFCRIFTVSDGKLDYMSEETSHKLKVTYETDELLEGTESVRVSLTVPELNGEFSEEASVYNGVLTLTKEFSCEAAPVYWDEFSKKLYEAELTAAFIKAGAVIGERRKKLSFGFCEVRTVSTQFLINGHNTFLRAVEADRNLNEKADWNGILEGFKRRGLNCVSVHVSQLSDKLLDASDRIGIYVKAHMTGDDEKISCCRLLKSFGNHPSFALLSAGDNEGKSLDENQMYSGGWVEFAVRDRQDYSDAPDTKSNHLDDIKNRTCPTMVTSVGEYRKPYINKEQGLTHLSQICTRESMEEALRTPKFGGFCLTGDAAVLELNERRMREFSCEVVPLLLMKKYVWSSDETFTADMMMANYGNVKFFERISVSAYDEHGQCFSVTTNKLRINCGGVMNLGRLTIPLSQFAPGQRIEITVSLDNTSYRNIYTIWLFADDISVKIPEHVHVTRKLDERTENHLKAGKKVLYIPRLNTLKGEPGWFSPMASEISSEREKVVSGGISCNPLHPALKGFPTEEFGDFQWWNLLHNCTPVKLLKEVGQIVSMPDETKKNASRGIVFEAMVGHGKLLVCTIDLLIQLDRPEARQMYSGLLGYAASNRFMPETSITLEELKRLQK